jgi:hypothetical protein
MNDPVDWTDDTPLRLKDAAAVAFPGGGMTPSGLRREALRGSLEIERIAGKDYVSLKAIAEMRRKCRVKPKRHPMEGWKAPQPALPDPLGRTPSQVAHDGLTYVLDKLKKKHEAKKEEQRRQRALAEPERRRRRLEERRAKARAKYLEKKAALAPKPGEP